MNELKNGDKLIWKRTINTKNSILKINMNTIVKNAVFIRYADIIFHTTAWIKIKGNPRMTEVLVDELSIRK